MSKAHDFWANVSETLKAIARGEHPTDLSFPARWQLSPGQRASLLAIADRLPSNGVVIADEVGMGKTRLAAAVARAVIRLSGRVAIVVPPGVGFQWADELRDADVAPSDLLRSLGQYVWGWNRTVQEAGANPWSQSSCVLVSHVFANWRLGESSQAWRWTVLPHVYALWRQRRSGRLPNGFHDDRRLENRSIAASAAWIVQQADRIGGSAVAFLDQLLEKTTWADTRDPAQYAKGRALRTDFERIIGLGLGEFDLVVIDEAHKSRSANTGLAKLLEHAIWTRSTHRRLALTATPVELHPDQWKDILHRINAKPDHIDATIDAYAKAVREVRLLPSNPEVRARFSKAACDFETCLTPYLLRRDKREDEAVRRFARGSGLGHEAYRRQTEILVDPTAEAMSLAWRRAICAAESLSHIRGDSDEPAAKRLRLTIGSGHGVASLLDQVHHNTHDDTDPDATAEDTEATSSKPSRDDTTPAAAKRLERHAWWAGIVRSVSDSGVESLYDHPAILAAVDAIESATAAGEKVLVFGRYTLPLRALVRLLNAREMWRAVGRKEPSPQSKIDEDEWLAVRAAHRQLGLDGPVSREYLEETLADGYRQIENKRERFRHKLLERLGEALKPSGPHLAIEHAILEAARRASTQEGSDDTANLARALHALGVDTLENDADLRHAFVELIGALRARNEGDDDGDGKLDDTEASALWAKLSERLRSEYSRTAGDHARLLYGGTEPATRRLLQLAFNREHSNPRVLVAQSMVGREGLNLHKACRTVVLLHPEWNPGVVEQQIGRVDRIGSRWQKLCEAHATGGCDSGEWPRIEIRPVIFKATYDEQNWAVLRERWRDLRAQLHGVVLQDADVGPELREVVRHINAAAPNFSPTRASPESVHERPAGQAEGPRC